MRSLDWVVLLGTVSAIVGWGLLYALVVGSLAAVIGLLVALTSVYG